MAAVAGPGPTTPPAHAPTTMARTPAGASLASGSSTATRRARAPCRWSGVSCPPSARFAHTAAMAFRACAKESSRSRGLGPSPSVEPARAGHQADAHPGGARNRRGAARGLGRDGRPRAQDGREPRAPRTRWPRRATSEASEEAAGDGRVRHTAGVAHASFVYPKCHAECARLRRRRKCAKSPLAYRRRIRSSTS